MNKLRDKTHIILIVLVLAFLGTIIFEWGMDYLGMRSGSTIPIGIVNGEEISAKDYDDMLQNYLDQQRQQTGQDLDDNMIQMIKNQVWDQLVASKLLEQQNKIYGIEVTNQELYDWVHYSPQTLPDDVKRVFLDSLGQFDMNRYNFALQSTTPEIQQFWAQVEQYLRQNLLFQKLQTLITATARVTDGDVLKKYKDDNIKASFNFVMLDISGIPDNQIQVSDEELKAFYEKNIDNYTRENSAKLKYVLFSDAATKDDSAALERQLNTFIKDLKKLVPGDSLTYGVVNDNSLSKFTNTFQKPSEFTTEVADFLFNAKKDSISGIIKASDGFTVVRLIDSREGEDVFVRASHILINFGTDTAVAKQKAEQILDRIKKGEDFSKMASELSDDPGSKVKGGDLGWFTKGAMVKEFEEAAMKAPIGSVTEIVKSQYGFHIIKVIDRQKKEFKAALIKKAVKPSSKSKEIARKKAEDFAFISRKGNFEEEAKKLNLPVLETPLINKGAFIPGAGQNANLVDFALKEKKGSISDPIKIQNGYGVYIISDKIPAGHISFEEAKTTVLMPNFLTEKKLEILKQQALDLKSKISGNDLNSLKAVNPTINIQSADTMTASAPSPSIGTDYDLFNILFKLQSGQVSEPIRSQRGYFIVQMKSITPFDPNAFAQAKDGIRTELLNQKKQAYFQEWLADLKEKSEIVDNRDKTGR